MTRILSVLCAAVILLMSTVQVDAAQRTRRQEKAEPPAPPPQFKVDSATRTMAMERFGIAVPVGSTIGKLFSDCDTSVTFEATLYSDNAFRGVPQQDYVAQFTAEATAAGYTLTTQQTGNLFDSQEAKAELIVGANVLALSEDACFESSFLGDPKGTRADATITVDWQVFDPLAKKLVFRATSEGKARTYIKKQHTQAIAIDGARGAFRNAAKNVLADPNFVAALRIPGAPPAPAGGVLFPESAGAAPPSTSSSQIKRLALSTTPLRDQINDLRKQVVTVRTPQGTGSGFFLTETLVITNQHVAGGFKEVRLRFADKTEIPAEVLATDAVRDVAILRTGTTGLRGLPLQTDAPAVASQVYVIGSPLGEDLEGTVTSGIVSAHRNLNGQPVIQSDVAVTHGNSGGPMFDSNGNVVALVVSGREPAGSQIGLNFFIPIGDALRALKIEFAASATATK